MWVARNKDGSLYLYDNKPHRPSVMSVWAMSFGVDGFWQGNDLDEMHKIDDLLFSDLNWEDEPIKVEIICG